MIRYLEGKLVLNMMMTAINTRWEWSLLGGRLSPAILKQLDRLEKNQYRYLSSISVATDHVHYICLWHWDENYVYVWEISKQQGAETASRGFDQPKERNHTNGMWFNTAKFRGILSRINKKYLLWKGVCQSDVMKWVKISGYTCWSWVLTARVM